jgi:hypothetical protein
MRKRKDMRFESRRGPRRKKKKNRFVSWKSLFFFFLFFHYSFFLCTSKMISRAWGSAPIAFLITQNWSTYDEGINKCSIIDRWSVMSRFTLPTQKKRCGGWVAEDQDKKCISTLSLSHHIIHLQATISSASNMSSGLERLCSKLPSSPIGIPQACL